MKRKREREKEREREIKYVTIYVLRTSAPTGSGKFLCTCVFGVLSVTCRSCVHGACALDPVHKL